MNCCFLYSLILDWFLWGKFLPISSGVIALNAHLICMQCYGVIFQAAILIDFNPFKVKIVADMNAFELQNEYWNSSLQSYLLNYHEFCQFPKCMYCYRVVLFYHNYYY